MPYYTSADGTRLHYLDSGEGRPALLFIHGWCGDVRHWEPQARAFRGRHRVVRVDRRGDGRSQAPARGYLPREQADDIATLVRSLRIRRVVAIGHAGGAPATLELAGRHPGLVSALVVVDWAPDLRPASQRRAAPLPEEGYEAALARRYEGFFGPAADRRRVRRWAAEAARTPRHVAMANRDGLVKTSPRALLRRVKPLPQPIAHFRFGDVELDFLNHRATRDGERLTLTARWFLILKLLIENRDRVTTRNELLKRIWGYSIYPTTPENRAEPREVGLS